MESWMENGMENGNQALAQGYPFGAMCAFAAYYLITFTPPISSVTDIRCEHVALLPRVEGDNSPRRASVLAAPERVRKKV